MFVRMSLEVLINGQVKAVSLNEFCWVLQSDSEGATQADRSSGPTPTSALRGVTGAPNTALWKLTPVICGLKLLEGVNQVKITKITECFFLVFLNEGRSKIKVPTNTKTQTWLVSCRRTFVMFTCSWPQISCSWCAWGLTACRGRVCSVSVGSGSVWMILCYWIPSGLFD